MRLWEVRLGNSERKKASASSTCLGVLPGLSTQQSAPGPSGAGPIHQPGPLTSRNKGSFFTSGFPPELLVPC